MKAHTNENRENQSESMTVRGKDENDQSSVLRFVDNRPGIIQMRKLQERINDSSRVRQSEAIREMADNSTQTRKAIQLQAMADHYTIQQQPIRRKENKTGLPDTLKSGVETLSGHSLDDVKVHYNSDKPAQLQAHAYARGTDIHVAPGQEKHLPHEAWHVVQQKQGRAKPTLPMKSGVAINDDRRLEKEADVMGRKALQMKAMQPQEALSHSPGSRSNIVQRYKFSLINGDSRNIDTYSDLIGVCKNFDKFDKFQGAEGSINDFKEAVEKAFNYHGLKSYKAIKGPNKEKKRKKLVKEVKQWKAEASLVSAKLHNTFKDTIDDEIKDDPYLTLFEDSSNKISAEDSEIVLCNLLYFFIKDKLEVERTSKQNERWTATQNEFENLGLNERQKKWLEEHKSDHYIEENTTDNQLEILRGSALTKGKVKGATAVNIKSYINKQLEKDHPLYAIRQKIKKLKKRVDKDLNNNEELKNQLTAKLEKLNAEISFNMTLSEWMFDEKSNVKLSMDGIDNDGKLEGFNLVMKYKGKTKTGKNAIVSYINKLIKVAEKTIDLSTNPNKETVAGYFFSSFGNDQRVAGKIINETREGNTGFKVSGKPVFHSSDGSGSTNDPGTVFWVHDSTTDKVTIVAQGKHHGNQSDEYLIRYMLDGVTVDTTSDSKVVKLNSSNKILTGSYDA